MKLMQSFNLLKSDNILYILNDMMLEYAVNDAGILESNLRDIHPEE